MGYQLIETIEVGAGGASSIEFTGIPQDGVDLVLLCSFRGTSLEGVDEFRFNFTGASFSAYSHCYLGGDGTSATSFTSEGATPPSAGICIYQNSSISTSNTFSNIKITASNYTSSANKSFSTESVTEDNSSTAYQRIIASTRPMSAITGLAISTYDALLAQYSTASLYKVTAD